MKKIILLLTCITFGFNGFSQQIVLNNTVNIKLPDRAEKLTKEQTLSFAGKRFKNDKIAVNAIATTSTPLYKVDNVLITLNAETGDIEKNHLIKLKKGLDEMSKKDKSYRSDIKIVNNNAILLTSHTWGEVVYYQFFCFSNTNSSAITGMLQYDRSDQANAATVLNDILKSIKFAK